MRDEDFQLNAWVDYHESHKAEWALSPDAFSLLIHAHKNFVDGWRAARDNTADTTRINEHYWSGFDAYFDLED